MADDSLDFAVPLFTKKIILYIFYCLSLIFQKLLTLSEVTKFYFNILQYYVFKSLLCISIKYKSHEIKFVIKHNLLFGT